MDRVSLTSDSFPYPLTAIESSFTVGFFDLKIVKNLPIKL